jgi:hypothetical protein
MPSIWLQVSDTNGNKVVENVVKIVSEPEDVDDLCEAIKVKVDPELNYCSVGRLSVYPAGTAFVNCNAANALDRGGAPPGGTTSKMPLVVIAPADSQGVWWLLCVGSVGYSFASHRGVLEINTIVSIIYYLFEFHFTSF